VFLAPSHAGILPFAQAFEYCDKFLLPLFTSPARGVRDLSWIEHDCYVVTFEVMNQRPLFCSLLTVTLQDRCESYALKSMDVDPNSDGVTQDVAVHTPVVVRLVGPYLYTSTIT
jgi:hypothetical protein